MSKMVAVVLCAGLFALGYFKLSGSAAPITSQISADAVSELKSFSAITGKTIVFFTADWCPGCKSLTPQLENFVKNNSGYTLRKVDIENWNSAIAQRFAIRSIPYLVLLQGEDVLAEGTKNVMKAISF